MAKSHDVDHGRLHRVAPHRCDPPCLGRIEQIFEMGAGIRVVVVLRFHHGTSLLGIVKYVKYVKYVAQSRIT